ncbi:MAG: hypothetical protein E6G39_03240 [Actinobacteria bacterium]|nr:MAG: hypothetical protein E6G39_03240 [Actinomycetota bacterium]
MGPCLRDRRSCDRTEQRRRRVRRSPGYRIELGEIEAALEDDQQVARAVVVAVNVDSITELVAFITPKDTASFDLSRVQRALATRLPEPMIPRGFDIRESLPTMPNGKTDRVTLVKSAAATLTGPSTAQIDQTTAATTPRADPAGFAPRDAAVAGADEAVVIEIWSTVLGRTIQRDDNFFEVGGHSLLAVKVFRLLGERVAVPLALTDIFRFPNARLLGAHLAALQAGAAVINGEFAAGATPVATSGDDRGTRRRNALLGRGRNN